MSAQFFGRSGKVLYGAFSIVGMAYQSQNVNNGIPDGRVSRSNQTGAVIIWVYWTLCYVHSIEVNALVNTVRRGYIYISTLPSSCEIPLCACNIPLFRLI